jgi:transposase-like protein
VSENQRPKRLTAKRKFELYLEIRAPEAPIGEILRRYGVHLPQLRRIEEVVESGAITALKADGGKRRQPSVVTPERVLQLEAELAEKTQALAELSVAYSLLEKKERAALRSQHQGSGSPRRNSK